jgi:multiple sugar transport system permease protein
MPMGEQSRKRPRPLERLSTGLVWAIGMAFALMWAVPLIQMITTSIKPPGEVLTHALSWIPTQPTVQPYVDVFKKPVLSWLVNSLVVTLTSTLLSLITGSMAGYALARLHFPGRQLVFWAVLVVLMIPAEVSIVPLYIGALRSGLLNGTLVYTWIVMIAPQIASAFSVYLFRNFFLSLPVELEDSAAIDGASRFRIFVSLAVPLAKPAMVAGAILLFANYWNTFLWPLLITSDDRLKTLPVGMLIFSPGGIGGGPTDINAYDTVMAAMTVLSLPTLVAFLILQRQFIEGATGAGIKG